MSDLSPTSVDVLVVGAGPVGLSAANLLAMDGVDVLVIDALPELIDYPRGVGIDDESLRSLQTMGLVEQALPFTTPQHVMRLVNGKGRLIAEIAPATQEFGWPRRNAFIQPAVDRVLLDGLARFPHAAVRFGHRAEALSPDPDGVSVQVSGPEGPMTIRCRWLVGADGGRSVVRKATGTSFDGRSPATRWLVIDVRNDPLGTPNIYLGCDPRRPYVSLGLPQGIRRFEFMLFDGESDDRATSPEFLDQLLAPHVPRPRSLDLIRARVYTHHSRVAGAFRHGPVLLAGDAAHLMPVWQGQGWNSGMRDATNLAWKLSAVVRGLASPDLLDTYDSERRDHARAMVELSTAFGRIVKPTNRLLAGLRDAAAGALNISETVKQYVVQMKYKPMPRYGRGVVVDATTLTPGRSGREVATGLHAALSAPNHASPVGIQFIQPEVTLAGGTVSRLDDAIGYRWAVLAWGANPETMLSPASRQILDRLGARLVSVRPPTQCGLMLPDDPEAVVLGDHTGALKRWFDARPTPLLVLRPDRFIAAATLTQHADEAVAGVARAVRLLPAKPSAAPTGGRAAQPVGAAS
jgi:3-(3-hydroxy-phenyl)propionate hydroxylase